MAITIQYLLNNPHQVHVIGRTTYRTALGDGQRLDEAPREVVKPIEDQLKDTDNHMMVIIQIADKKKPVYLLISDFMAYLFSDVNWVQW